MNRRLCIKITVTALLAVLAWNAAVLAVRNHLVPGQDVPVLLFHETGAGEKDRFLSAEQFVWMMDYLKKNRFTVISISDYIDIMDKKKKMPPQPAVITFDDGTRSVYTVSFPALKDRGFGATVFLASGFMGKTLYHTLEDRVYSRDQPEEGGKRVWKFEMLTWGEIRDMEKGGFSFQSHSIDHAELKKMSHEELKEQFLGSKKAIESQTGRPVEYFSYPWGEFNDLAMKTLKECGYKAAFISETEKPAFSGYRGDLYALGRYEISPFTKRINFKLIVWGLMPLKEKFKHAFKRLAIAGH